MKKMITLMVILLTLVSGAFAAAWTGSTSEPESTRKIDGKSFYVITTANELAWFAAQVNAGKTTINAVLDNDIVFGTSTTTNSSVKWTPIGTSARRFNGIFDGNGKKIYGLNANGSGTDAVEGIFGYVGASGNVKNVTLAYGIVGAQRYAGAIVAINEGIIENCKNMVRLYTTSFAGGWDGNANIGGIVGWNEKSGLIKNCINSGEVVNVLSTGYIGGIVGNNEGKISNCSNSGIVRSNIDGGIWDGGGGIAGNNAGSIEKCVNTNTVTSSYCNTVGGIAAINVGSISNCYNTALIRSYKQVKDGAGFGSPILEVSCDNSNQEISYLGDIKNSYDSKTQKYWLNNKVVQGTAADMQKDQFAWILNSSNGAQSNSGVWTRGSTGYPTFATSSSLAIRKIVFNDDGSTNNRYTNYQGKVSFPSDPTPVAGYVFSGWYNSSGTKVSSSTVFTADQTITAKYSKIYSIKFFNETTLLQTLSVEGGVTPVYTGAEPTKNADAQYTYTFSGWTPAIAAASKDASYQATFTNTLRSYTITFKNYDGTQLQSSVVNYGATPIYSKTPTHAFSAEWDYKFTRWTPEIISVTGDAVYTALYDSSKFQYQITFNNYDGSKLAIVNTDYGDIPFYNGTPTRTGSAEWAYTFKEWSPSLKVVTTIATYTAVYDSSVAKYDIFFKDYDGKVLQTAKLEYGTMPTAPTAPSRTATAEWSYTFAGWDKEFASVSSSVEYKAVYDSIKNSYEVTFVDFDNSEIQKTVLEYGETPTCTKIPTRESSAEWNYDFKGWNPAIASVTGKTTYKAVYDSSKVKYVVSLMSEGSAVQTENVAYGETFTIPRGVAKNGYTFVGWYVGEDLLGNIGDVIVITKNISAEAKFSINSYVIKFLDFDGVVLKKDSYEYESIPVYGSAVSREATAEWNYEFIGWTPAIGKVIKATNYTATYDSTKVKYEVVFMNGNAEIDAQEVEYGSAAEKPADPKKAGYTFVGWNKDFSNVTENLVVEALFEENVASSSSKEPESSSSAENSNSSSSSSSEKVENSSSSEEAVVSSSSKKSESSSSSAVIPAGFIDDIEDGNNETYTGGFWFTYNDAGDKGESTISNEKDKYGGYVVVFPGSNGTEGMVGLKDINLVQGGNEYEPYVALGLFLKNEDKAYDLSSCKAISYDYIGAAHHFQAILAGDISGKLTKYNRHSTEVPASTTWTTANIAWSDLHQATGWGTKVSLNKALVSAFHWEVKGEATPDYLYVDNFKCDGLKITTSTPSSSSFAKPTSSSSQRPTIVANSVLKGVSVTIVNKNLQISGAIVDVDVFDLQGRLLKTLRNVQGSVNFSTMPSGNYIIRVSSGAQNFTQRMSLK